jgi:hypothetical protein
MVGTEGVGEGHAIEVELVCPGGGEVPQNQVNDGVLLAMFAIAGGDVGGGEEGEAVVHHPFLDSVHPRGGGGVCHRPQPAMGVEVPRHDNGGFGLKVWLDEEEGLEVRYIVLDVVVKIDQVEGLIADRQAEDLEGG